MDIKISYPYSGLTTFDLYTIHSLQLLCDVHSYTTTMITWYLVTRSHFKNKNRQIVIFSKVCMWYFQAGCLSHFNTKLHIMQNKPNLLPNSCIPFDISLFSNSDILINILFMCIIGCPCHSCSWYIGRNS